MRKESAQERVFKLELIIEMAIRALKNKQYKDCLRLLKKANNDS